MIFHENRLADDSDEISYLIFFRKLEKVLQNLSSAAVVIGALRVKHCKQFGPVDKKKVVFLLLLSLLLFFVGFFWGFF